MYSSFLFSNHPLTRDRKLLQVHALQRGLIRKDRRKVLRSP
jgi:hypothetical protein